MQLIMEKVTVRVPASTSNLGPGYDCLGVALRIYNHVTLTRATRGKVPPIVAAAADRFFGCAELRPIRFACEIVGHVPVSRGLGSSVTVRLGVILGLNALAGRPLTRQQCFELCAELEGHPDNAAPATFGGFNVISGNSRQRFAVSARLRFVLLVPAFEVRTEEARKLLPMKIERQRAIESCANACAITAAFASGDHEAMRGKFTDYLHQPFRKALNPFFDAMVTAAESAGALGGFLSGSGSTVAALVLKNADAVARAMSEASAQKGAQMIITAADNSGARVLVPTK